MSFKKFIALVIALNCSTGEATTLSPIQLLNPAGSTSGQAVLSTGPSTAPAWGNVSISTLTGVLPVANGGTNASTASGTSLDNIAGFSATGFLTRTGAGAYAFQSATNGITLGNLAQASANTVLANATGSTANLVAFSMPSCSTSASALNWTTSTGFTCNTSINAATLGGATFAAPGPIGSTTAGTGAFTTLSASSTVSGTGFSTYLASPPAIGTTVPAGGKFTTLQATSTITPSTTSGIVGTTAADNANTGSVGEYPSNSTSATSLSNNTPANATSVSLPAGDWEVQCIAQFNPAGTTVPSLFIAGVNTTSATRGAFQTENVFQASIPAGSGNQLPTPLVRINVSSTTTAYCVVQAAFTVSTMTVTGYIWARRPR